LLTTILAFVFVFSIIILAHELGHFGAAKLSGVKVEEFGLGYPPRIWGFRRGETLYSINWLPFGGFTKMTGEENPEDKRSLAGKSRLIRLFVLSAGALVNALLPFFLLTAAFMVPHNVVVGQVQVMEIAAASPAQAAGLETGDIITSVNGKNIRNIADLSRNIELNLGKETLLVIQKAGGSNVDVTLVPRWDPPEGEGALGVSIQLQNAATLRESQPFWRAIPMGINQTFETFSLFKNAILSLFVGTSAIQLAGPVGIAQITGEAAQAGLSPLLEFAAFLSLNLAIFNLLPLPALDGGRILFVLLEWVRGGKRVSPKTEGMVHMIGFALLILVALAVTFQDILRIIQGGSLSP
jgi:regulator of sigma E protease